MARQKASSPLFDGLRRGERRAEEEVNLLIREFARHVCYGQGPGGAPEYDWEDVAQEASRRLFTKGIDQFRGAGSDRSYIYSIVRAAAIRLARTSLRRRFREEASEQEEAVLPRDVDLRLDLDRILGRLNPGCRAVLERIFLDGATYPAVAQELGLAESSVRARVSRCIRSARGLVA